ASRAASARRSAAKTSEPSASTKAATAPTSTAPSAASVSAAPAWASAKQQPPEQNLSQRCGKDNDGQNDEEYNRARRNARQISRLRRSPDSGQLNARVLSDDLGYAMSH